MCETENDSETKRPDEDKHEETNIKTDRKDLFLCDCTNAEHFKDLLRTKSLPHQVLVITINVIAQLLC